MIKSIVVIVVAALLVGVALAGQKEAALDEDNHVLSAEELIQRQKCVDESAEYISKAPVAVKLGKLVDISRRFYDDAEKLIVADTVSDEYEAAMKRAGPQEGCDELVNHITALSETCFEKMLSHDWYGLLNILQSKREAGLVIEAYYACTTIRDA